MPACRRRQPLVVHGLAGYGWAGDNEEDDAFDLIVGALEDIMMDPEFQELQSSFAAEHCAHFDATDEVCLADGCGRFLHACRRL